MKASLLHLAAAAALASALPNDGPQLRNSGYKYLAVFSIDGLHASDLDKYVARGPSNITNLLKTGHKYSNAWTSFPSDSFPGTLAPFTGASPRTTGVWYDDAYDRTYYAPGLNCKGPAGADVVLDETVDFNSSLLFSGGMDPAKLPQAIVNGKCTSVYPHARVRVNTVWEVAVAAGLKTAYTDKHPAYDLVRGPSGTGLTTGYFPEINYAGSPTSSVATTIPYDQLHVDAFLKWLDGADVANAEGSLKGAVPSLFGGNFQVVSVGQKTKGYVNGTLDFSPDLLKALNFVDASLGAVVNKLKAKGFYSDTLIIVVSKHGQSPIDPSLFKEVSPANFTTALAVKTDHLTLDDVALIFLNKSSDLATAVKNLNAHKADLRIDDIIYGQRQVDLGYGDATKDPAVPDIIVQPIPGTIYTTSKSKVAEHGGGAADDRHVACFLSSPRLTQKTFGDHVQTKQVGPVIVRALGLHHGSLKGAVAEGTKPLPGFWGQE